LQSIASSNLKIEAHDKVQAAGARQKRFATFAWMILAYTLLIVLWGAFVRATGSGAGCGSHWPLCNGEIIPRAPGTKTLIEYTHRLMTAPALLLFGALIFWARRAFPRGSIVRRGAWLSLIFVVTESLIGAGIVKLEHVADNASIGRAFTLSFHLINTFILIAILALTAWWAGAGAERWRLNFSDKLFPILALCFLGALLTGVSGAIAALGDTLFPVSSLSEGVRQDFSPTAHFLIRLRLFHPVIAVATALLILFAANRISSRDETSKRLAHITIALVVIQLIAGAINVWLLAPVWMQILHLFLADALWIALVLLSFQTLARLTPVISSFENRALT
jgi:heme A synthase